MNNVILFWNDVANEAARLDFVPPEGKTKVEPEQGGPTRTSRAYAVVHIAMYDAWSGVMGQPTYQPGLPAAGTNSLTGARAATAAAACVSLIHFFPRSRDLFVRKHEEYVASLPGSDPAVGRGIAFGQTVARSMIASRTGDGSQLNDALYAPSPEPGRHRVDPVSPNQGFLGPQWGSVKPFGIENLVTVVPPVDPPAFGSAAYKDALNEVKSMGSASNTTRTPAQTTVGVFWAYDGANGIGVPPRLYNQVLQSIAKTKASDEAACAKLFAICNVAMADAGIQCWATKYRYNIWRPVIGVREASLGWGPTGAGDGNPDTSGDPYWLPLGAPRTNQVGVHSVTPSFPAYPSGHATFGAACLSAAQKFYGGEDVAFKFVSDELDGKNVDSDGSIRPRFDAPLKISTAIAENSISRVYLGVHWRFDATEGERAGKIIGDKVAMKFPQMA